MASSSATASEKRKQRLPAEDAEVIALPPEILTATSRFFCDVCSKGFQREQNLQLHRRSHNLSWELKPRAGGAGEPRKRVYVCPVSTCAHHEPAKALGDLSGIKKHFCRKHGERKFNCHGCGKKYAVQSDVRAHMKVCGTKTHHCACGTQFTKWENFARHKQYCDMLIQAIARHEQAAAASSSHRPPPSLTLSMASPVPSGRQSSEFPGNQSGYSDWREETLPASAAAGIVNLSVRDSPSTSSGNIKGGENEVFGGGLPASSTPARQSLFSKSMAASCSDVFRAPVEPTPPLSFPSPRPHFSVNASSSQYVAATPHPALSATALLQKAAQIGSTYSAAGGSILHGLGLSVPSDFNPPNIREDILAGQNFQALTRSIVRRAEIGPWALAQFDTPMNNGHAIPENTPTVSSGGYAGLPDSMLEQPSPATIIGNQLQTFDFLGVGGGNGDGGDVPFFGSLGFGEYCWDNPSDRNLGGFP